jgi:hypothetical protein
MTIHINHELVTSNLIRRTDGGWLVIAPLSALFSIGVTAFTESETWDKFCFVYNRWIEIRGDTIDPDTDVLKSPL